MYQGEYNKPLCSLLSTIYKRYSHRLTQSCKSTGLNTQPLVEVISIPDHCTIPFCYHLTLCKGDGKARRRSSYHVSDIEGRGILMEPFLIVLVQDRRLKCSHKMEKYSLFKKNTPFSLCLYIDNDVIYVIKSPRPHHVSIHISKV